MGLPEEFKIQVFGHDGTVPKRVTSTTDGLKERLDVSLGLAMMPGFNVPPYTRIDATYPSASQEVYVYKDGLTTVATITVNYTDTTKNYFLNAEKT
jgi:hypothetical protein